MINKFIRFFLLILILFIPQFIFATGDEEFYEELSKELESFSKEMDNHSTIEANINSSPIQFYFFKDTKNRTIGFIEAGHSDELLCSAVSALLWNEVNKAYTSYPKKLPLVTAGFGMYFIPEDMPEIQREQTISSLNSLVQKIEKIQEQVPNDSMYIHHNLYSDYLKATEELHKQITAGAKRPYSWVENFDLSSYDFPVLLPYFGIYPSGKTYTISNSLDQQYLPKEGVIPAFSNFSKTINREINNMQIYLNTAKIAKKNDQLWVTQSQYKIKKGTDISWELDLFNLLENHNISENNIYAILKNDGKYTIYESVIYGLITFLDNIDTMNALLPPGSMIPIDFLSIDKILMWTKKHHELTGDGDYTPFLKGMNGCMNYLEDFKKAVIPQNNIISKDILSVATSDSFMRGWFLEYADDQKNQEYDNSLYLNRTNTISEFFKNTGFEYITTNLAEKSILKEEEDKYYIVMAIYLILADQYGKMSIYNPSYRDALEHADPEKFKNYEQLMELAHTQILGQRTIYDHMSIYLTYNGNPREILPIYGIDDLNENDQHQFELLMSKISTNTDIYALQLKALISKSQKLTLKKTNIRNIIIKEIINYAISINYGKEAINGNGNQILEKMLNDSDYCSYFLDIPFIEFYKNQTSVEADRIQILYTKIKNQSEPIVTIYDRFIRNAKNYIKVPLLEGQQVLFFPENPQNISKLTMYALLSDKGTIIFDKLQNIIYYY